MKVDKLVQAEQEGKWTFNDKSYDSWDHDHFDTREEAIEEGRKHAIELGWNMLFVGKVTEPSVGLCGDHAIDEAYDQVNDQCGEFAESYLSYVTMEQRFELGDMLTKVFNEWSEKHDLQPTMFTITETEEIKLQWEVEGEESYKADNVIPLNLFNNVVDK